MGACCLLAAWLRLYKLNDANPWWDEGFTYWLASQDLPGMLLRTAGDTHPPLSYALYQLWMPLAGRAIYALRFQAVAFGVLTVPLCAALARRLGGSWAGAAAALLLAISPFHIWWSQQIRMYALVGLLCALSMYLLVAELGARRSGPGTRAALGLTNLAGLYSLYFFAVLVVLEGVFIAWLWLRGDRRRGLPLAACLVPSALLLPWLAFFRQHAITFPAPATSALSWGEFLQASWSEVTLGIDTGVQAFTPLLIALGAAAAGLLAILLLPCAKVRDAGTLRRFQCSAWLLLVAAGLPLAAYGVTRIPGLFYSAAYQTRYDLPALPALIVLLALGISNLPAVLSRVRFQNAGLLSFLPLALFAGAAVWSLPRLYDARHRTDDYQSLARFVEAYQRPGDAIVFDPDWNFHLFLLDYHGGLPFESIPLHQEVDAAWAAQAFSTWTRQYRAIWLLQEAGGHDAGAAHPVREWLDSHLQPGLQLTSGDRTLTLYQPASAPPRTLSPGFQPQVRTAAIPGLTGFDQPLDDVRPGDMLRLTLYGSSLQVAALSVAGRAFSGRALPGALDFGLPIGAWPETGRQRIDAILADGSRQPLSSVSIEARPALAVPAAEPLAHAAGRDFGGLALLTSYEVDPPHVAPGQELSVRLQWRGLQPFAANYTVFVHLLDAANHVVAQRDSQPLDGRLPTIAWQPGQVLDDEYRIALPRELAPGDYKVELGLYLQATGQRLALSDDASQDHLILGDVTVLKDPSQ